MFLYGSENQFSEAKVLLLTKVGFQLLKNFMLGYALDLWESNLGKELTWTGHSTKDGSQINSFLEEIRLFWSRMRIIFDQYNF